MWPYVIENPIKIGTYGVMMAIGFLTANWLLVRDLRRRNIDPKVAETTIFLGIVGGVVGAKLAYMLTEADSASFKDFFSGSGLTWHGGLILAAALIIGWYIKKKLPVLVMVDAVAPTLASGYAFGRIGCQLSGDGDYGIACGRWLDQMNCWVHNGNISDALARVCFDNPASYDVAARADCPMEFCLTNGFPGFCMSYARGIVPTGELVHPTPVYESINNFILFGVLWAIRRRIKHPGVLFGIYLIGSWVLRFLIEFIRQEESRPYRFLGLRDAQLVALGQVVLGIGIIIYSFARGVPEGQAYGVLAPAPVEAPKPSRKRRS